MAEVVDEWRRLEVVAAWRPEAVPLRRAVQSGDSVYLPDDVHWNAEGHRVVAMAVADRIHQSVRPANHRGAAR